jgi:hypothetical protein
MANSSSTQRIDKLTEHNYKNWEFQIRAYLGARGLRSYLEHTPTGDAATEEAVIKADTALCELQLSISNSMIHVVKGKETAEEAWKAIKAYFKAKTDAQVTALAAELSNLQMRPRESISSYFQRADRLNDLLADVDYKVNEKTLYVQLINGLSKDYDSVRHAFLIDSGKFTDPDTGAMLLKAKLAAVEASIQAKSSSSSKDEAKALVSVKTCSHCNRKGHDVSECRTLKREKAKKDGKAKGDGDKRTTKKCDWCGKPGHVEDDCYAKRDGKAKKGDGGGSSGDGDSAKTAHAFLAMKDPYPAPPTRYDPSDFAMVDSERSPLYNEVGQPTFEYFTDYAGNNAHLPERCYKHGNSFYDGDHVSGKFGWANPPFREAEHALRHYFTCKGNDPTNTSSIWILPYEPAAKWYPLVANMRLLRKWPAGTMLFTLPDLKAPGLRRVLKPTPFPVMALYDAPLVRRPPGFRRKPAWHPAILRGVGQPQPPPGSAAAGFGCL